MDAVRSSLAPPKAGYCNAKVLQVPARSAHGTRDIDLGACVRRCKVGLGEGADGNIHPRAFFNSPAKEAAFASSSSCGWAVKSAQGALPLVLGDLV